ncbi:hypothetical protein RFW89_11145, partial [Acinetobacter baumannii]|nr:hypothetical protein [Acinetobacter baumannii]
MSCSWLFEDRTETWLTTSRSRIGNFPIITYIPKGFKIDQAEIPVAAEPSKEENAEMIINYFKSEDF